MTENQDPELTGFAAEVWARTPYGIERRYMGPNSDGEEIIQWWAPNGHGISMLIPPWGGWWARVAHIVRSRHASGFDVLPRVRGADGKLYDYSADTEGFDQVYAILHHIAKI